MKRFMYLVFPLILGILFLVSLNYYLDYEINQMLNSKDLTELKSKYASDVKDNGITINNHFLNNGDIMFVGASDLIHSTRQRPDYFFNRGKTKNEAFTIGRSFTQEIQNSLEIGSLDNNIKDKKVVLLVAFSWFVYPDGISPKDFQGRFSPVQFYKFFQNPKITDETKIDFAKRISELLATSDEYKSEYLYSKLYSNKSISGELLKGLFYPYFKFREAEVTLKEKGILYKELKRIKKDSKDSIEKNKDRKNIKWDEEYAKAYNDSKKRVGNNPFGLDQKYYEKKLKPNLKKMKDKYKDVDILNVKELSDYEYMLNVCKELGIDPTVVIIPGLPDYYEYCGVSKEDQKKLYIKIKDIAKEKGFKVVDTSSKAGNKYYMRDVMHIGTVGWTDVSKSIYEIYNQKLDNN